MSASMEQAKQLYKDGQYLEAMKMCRELATDKTQMKDMWLLTAKCIMVSIVSPEDEDSLDEVADSVIRAINETESIEEAFEVWLDFLSAFSLWEKKIAAKTLAEVEANPTEETLNVYKRLFIRTFTASIRVTVPAKNKSIMPALAQKVGLTIPQAVEKYENKKPYEKYYTPAVQDEMEFETASRIMAQALAEFEQNQNISAAKLEAVRMSVGTKVIVATTLYKPLSETEREGIPDNVRFERLKEYASWLTFLLSARFHVDGVERKLYSGDASDIKNIKDAYAKMRAIDPSFEAPALPKIANNTSGQTSGGCYVATAVYGSYDCPQVWTLRRYRDETLARTWYGRAFIRTYYAVSPTLVKWFGNTEWFKNLWQGKLDRMVARLQAEGVESTPYEDKAW